MNRTAWSNIRGLSTIAVILIHITSSKIIGTDMNSILNLIFNQISRFAVPVFLIASGYGLQTKYANLQRSELRTFYKKRMKIIPGYLLWNCIYFFINNLGDWDISDFIYGLITGTTYGHLYFIVVLIICYLFFPFLHKFVSTVKGISLFLGITLIGQLIYLSGITWGSPYIWNWLFYFMLGIFLSSNPIKFQRLLKNGRRIYIAGISLVLISSLTSLFIFQRDLPFTTTAMKPSVIILSVGVLSIFLNNFPIENKFLNFFDSYSLDIYYVHQLFIILGNKGLELIGIEGNSFLITILLLVIVTFVSLVFSLVFNYIKKSKFMSFRKFN